jgi:hypothetical protein
MTGRFEKSIYWIVFLIFLTAVSVYKISTWYFAYGDNAFLVQLASNIAQRGLPFSQVSSSIAEMFQRLLLVQPAKVICGLDLKFSQPYELNYFRWHTYFILCLLAPIHRILSPEVFLSFLTALSFVGLLALVYRELRARQVSVVWSLLVTALIMLHPAWGDALSGQVYIDRFFLPLGFLLVAELQRPATRFWIVAGLSVLIASLSDRFGIIVATILVGHSCLYFKRPKQLPWKLFALAGGLALLSFLNVKFYNQHPQYGSFSSSMQVSTFLGNILHNEDFRAKLAIFLKVNFLYFGLAAFFSWRLLLLSLVLMAPNIMGNIGGAEKVAFSLHYHSVYFPIFCWALIDGFTWIYRRVSLASGRWHGFATAMLAILVLQASYSPYEPGQKQFVFHSTSFAPWSYWKNYFNGVHRTRVEFVKSIRSHIPEGASVTLPEDAMPWMVRGHDLYYYPIGLAEADYALLPFSGDAEPAADVGSRFGGVFTVLQGKDKRDIHVCLEEKMRSFGYDLDHPTRVGSWAILQRKGKESGKNDHSSI